MFLLAPLLIAAIPAQAQEASRGLDQLRAAMMHVQNMERRMVGEKMVKWSDALAADALVHAQWMASTGRFEHTQNLNNQGENLWAGTRGHYTYESMAQDWADEKRFYLDKPSPDNSSSGRWGDVGHYTQMVWANTTEMGCAMASSADMDYLVCRYSPPGNWSGEKAFEPIRP